MVLQGVEVSPGERRSGLAHSAVALEPGIRAFSSRSQRGQDLISLRFKADRRSFEAPTAHQEVDSEIHRSPRVASLKGLNRREPVHDERCDKEIVAWSLALGAQSNRPAQKDPNQRFNVAWVGSSTGILEPAGTKSRRRSATVLGSEPEQRFEKLCAVRRRLNEKRFTGAAVDGKSRSH